CNRGNPGGVRCANHSRVGLEERFHAVLVAGEYDDEIFALGLHHLQEDLDGFLPIVTLVFLAVEVVGLFINTAGVGILKATWPLAPKSPSPSTNTPSPSMPRYAVPARFWASIHSRLPTKGSCWPSLLPSRQMLHWRLCVRTLWDGRLRLLGVSRPNLRDWCFCA